MNHQPQSFNFLDDDIFSPSTPQPAPPVPTPPVPPAPPVPPHTDTPEKAQTPQPTPEAVTNPQPITPAWKTMNDHSPVAEQTIEEPPVSTSTQDDSKSAAQALNMIAAMRNQLDALEGLLRGNIQFGSSHTPPPKPKATVSGDERVVEGVFSGEAMVGPDGETYSVPPNYASKSKLVEGDLLKLTISPSGSFIYKQISPVERKRVVGELVYDQTAGQFNAFAEGRSYKLLTAAVTFYKGKSGDEVVILVPEDGQSSWAAVENIINK